MARKSRIVSSDVVHRAGRAQTRRGSRNRTDRLVGHRRARRGRRGHQSADARALRRVARGDRLSDRRGGGLMSGEKVTRAVSRRTAAAATAEDSHDARVSVALCLRKARVGFRKIALTRAFWRGLSRGAGEANVWSNGSNPWNLRKIASPAPLARPLPWSGRGERLEQRLKSVEPSQIALTRAFGAASPAERERRTSRRVG